MAVKLYDMFFLPIASNPKSRKSLEKKSERFLEKSIHCETIDAGVLV